MPDSNFITAFNEGNAAFAADCAEQFEIMEGGGKSLGIPGTYWATTIDDLVASSSVAPGGFKGENTNVLYVNDSVIEASQMQVGCILRVRGERLRVNSFGKDDDDTQIVNCGGTGLRIK